MNKYMQEFIDSTESQNTQKVIKYVFKRIDEDNIENYNSIQTEQLILNMQPNSSKEIITIIYIFSSYAKWLNNDNLYNTLQSLDKKLLWKRAKPNAKKKFINNEEYQRVVKDIATYEEYNALYYELLFSCIWSGIYNDDLSVIKNLRTSNIDDNGIVMLEEDNGHSYKFKISEKLASDLKQLASISAWQRPNRFGICNVEMRGVYNDSIFKVEHRSTSSNGSYRFSYYAKLRKIAKEYLEYSLLNMKFHL